MTHLYFTAGRRRKQGPASWRPSTIVAATPPDGASASSRRVDGREGVILFALATYSVFVRNSRQAREDKAMRAAKP